jgi:pimeloyl-ACP methyl ester carboxylesterase
LTPTQQAELHFEVAGEGSPVVLIHEGICDSRMWEPQWRPFTAAHKVVRYDMRGFGETPLEPGPYSHARDLVGLLTELDLGPAALVGVSLGGSVALQVALARPALVSALVLVGVGLGGWDWSDETKAGWEEEEAALERRDLDAAVEVNLRMWVAGPDRSLDEVDPEVIARVAEMQRRAFELWLPVGEDAKETLVEGVSERLGEIAMPTLVLVGDRDRPEMLAIADRLATEIPGAKRATIADTAHVPSMERPVEFDQLVLGFLSEIANR